MVEIINKTLLMYGITAVISFIVAALIQLLFRIVRSRAAVNGKLNHGKDAHI